MADEKLLLLKLTGVALTYWLNAGEVILLVTTSRFTWVAVSHVTGAETKGLVCAEVPNAALQ